MNYIVTYMFFPSNKYIALVQNKVAKQLRMKILSLFYWKRLY